MEKDANFGSIIKIHKNSKRIQKPDILICMFINQEKIYATPKGIQHRSPRMSNAERY